MIDILTHRKVALELSGGKDSVAALYLLKEYLPIITVYWLNTGDNFPETLDVIAKCKEMCPNFVEINVDVRQWIARCGTPSDVVPVTGRQLHQPLKNGEIVTVESMMCCAHNIMLPLHSRVIQDGNTCVIRGQKECDTNKAPIKSGDWSDGVQFIFPVEDWTDEQVLDYLQRVEAPIHPVYAYSPYGADCMHCTGWWDKTSMEFLKRYPTAHKEVVAARETIKWMSMTRLERC